MPKYIIIDRALTTCSPITNIIQFTPASMLGTIDTRSRKRAETIAYKTTGKSDLSIVSYNSPSVTKLDRAHADAAPVLDVPDKDKPNSNPVGRQTIGVPLRISTVVSPEVAQKYEGLENKSAFVAAALASAMGL